MDKLPVYDATIERNDYDTGMFRISLVKYPATETDWLCFSKNEPFKKVLYFNDGEEQCVRSVVMLADTAIYRRDWDGYEYYIRFSKDTLKLMAEKFLAMGYPNSFNTEHNPDTFVPGMYMRELFIKDVENGINPKGFENVPDGSLFATAKVTDSEVWEKIKNGTWSGFSLEGVFNMIDVAPEEDPEEAEIMSLIEKIKNKIK